MLYECHLSERSISIHRLKDQRKDCFSIKMNHQTSDHVHMERLINFNVKQIRMNVYYNRF